MTVDKIVIMDVKNITQPFNKDLLVEITLKSSENEGELYLRVPAFEADKYEVGQTCAIRISKI